VGVSGARPAGDAPGEVVEDRRAARLHVLWRTREILLLAVGGALFAVFALTAPHFLELQNLLSVARGTVMVAIIAVGMTYLIIAGELDLSVGANFAVATIVLGELVLEYGWDAFAAMVAVLLLGALIGLINGLGVTRTGIPSLIWTLAATFILQSTGLLITGGYPILFPVSKTYSFMFGGRIGPVNVQIIWAIVILALGAWMLARTRFGYHVYATGGNTEAAERAGINVRRVKVLCFVMTGFLSSFAGVLLTGLVQSGNPTNGMGYQLTVIAAVVIGGTNLFGGSGTVAGTAVGATILSLIGDGLVLDGISVFAQDLVTGIIIIIAVFMDIQLRQRILRFVK
jgi:ribose transport system permease protein